VDSSVESPPATDSSDYTSDDSKSSTETIFEEIDL
jgi:hypothetical protein